MPTRYCKWIFVGSFTSQGGYSYSELLRPLEEICEIAGEGYAFHAAIRFARSPKRIIFNVPEPIYGAGLQAGQKFTRKYVMANRQGELSFVEHNLRLNSRTRSTTVVSKVGYEHPQLLRALHDFYGRDDNYNQLYPEIPQPFIIVDNP